MAHQGNNVELLDSGFIMATREEIVLFFRGRARWLDGKTKSDFTVGSELLKTRRLWPLRTPQALQIVLEVRANTN